MDRLHVERLDVLVVDAAVRQTRIVLQILEKVIQGNDRSVTSLAPQRIGQFVGRRRLSRRTGAGEHDDPRAAFQHAVRRVFHTADVVRLAQSRKLFRLCAARLTSEISTRRFGIQIKVSAIEVINSFLAPAHFVEPLDVLQRILVVEDALNA